MPSHTLKRDCAKARSPLASRSAARTMVGAKATEPELRYCGGIAFVDGVQQALGGISGSSGSCRWFEDRRLPSAADLRGYGSGAPFLRLS